MKIPLDFSNVPERGKIRVPEGDYVAKVVNVEKTTSKSSNNPMLVVTFELQGGEFAGKKIKDNHVLTENSLWTLRNLLENMGWKVKPSTFKLDTDKMLMNRKVGLTIIDGEEYKGRISSEIADYIPPEVVGTRVPTDGDLSVFDEEDEDEDEVDDLDALMDDEDEDEEVDEEEDEDEEDDEDEDDDIDFDFDDDEDEDEEDEDEYPTANEIRSAKGAQLKEWAKEWGVELKKGMKVAQVKKVLIEFVESDEDDAEDLEDFDLEDLE